jgi:uncharacterized delta-60 repeat protein
MSREVEMKARVVLCALLIACGKVESGGDVTLTLQPPSVFFRRGETAMVQVTATDAVNAVNVTADGLPPGVTADALALDGPAPGMLALHADATATEGIASVTLTADVGGTAALRLLVGGPPGTLDESFASGGKLVPQLSTLSLASRGMVFTDAGAVVTGFVQASPPQAITLRVKEDGTLDPAFGSGGFVSTGAGSVAEGIALTTLPDGHVIVAGVSGGTGSLDNDFGLYGYTAAGELDASFGASGVASFDPGSGFGELHSVNAAPDGSLLVGGTLFSADGSQPPITRALRYSPGGVQDPAYNVTEANVAMEGSALQGDGKLVLVGSQGNNFWIARYGTGGGRDMGFGSGGIVTTAFGTGFANANGVVVLSGGKLLVVGTATDSAGNAGVALARYNANGSLDATFGTGGKLQPPVPFTSFSPTAVIGAGTQVLFVGGVGQVPAVVRLNGDGTPDATFGTGGVVTVDFGVTGSSNRTQAFGIATDPDGRILISAELGPSGTESLGVARLWP